MKRFLLILQFMTRIPINKNMDATREDYSKGVIYFPIIGLIIGIITGLVVILSTKIFSPVLAAQVGVIVAVIVTGGLHLDGVSDTCDGIFSGRSKEKILEIMTDSRLGTFGGVGLILLMISKLALFYEVISNSMSFGNNIDYNWICIIILAPIAARSIVVFFMYKRKYAREEEGLGDLFIGKVTTKILIINQVILLCMIFIINYKFIASYLITLLIMIFIRGSIEKKLGGLTGDILGLSIELSEIIFIFMSIGGMRMWS